MKKISALFALAFILQGCVFVVGAAAGAAAAVSVYDHRKIEQVTMDAKISNDIIYKINIIPAMKDNGHISVTTFNGIVLLTGETTSTALRDQVDQIAHAEPDVTKVYNQVLIKGMTSSLTHASDSWITTKIKTQMLATKDLKSGTIKVVTENGTVYLMGIVSQEQAEATVDISRKVAGVQKVVKIFQYKN